MSSVLSVVGNREVRVVSNASALIICQVCVAKCAEIFDEEVGVTDPVDWQERWPLKQSARHDSRR